MRCLLQPVGLLMILAVVAGAQDQPQQRDFRLFHVKYTTADTVYLDGGSAAGLVVGSRLSIKRPGPGETALAAKPLAEVVVASVATVSALCEIRSSDQSIEPGDVAYLSSEDAVRIAERNVAKEAEKYPQVVTFTGGDPLQEELREEVPKPPLAEINRFRGRIALEESAIYDHGSGAHSYEHGLVLRTEMTRIGGTYWNLNGYWRGVINKQPGLLPQQTLTDVLNRVYHIGLRYDSPQSRYVAGFGRLLLPWASSISTIDGGYFGRRFGKGTTIGTFAGSTPDPTAWNYAPGRQILGSFVSNEAGTADELRHISTAGVAVTRIHWKPERQFVFVENSFLFKRRISFYHNIEADYLGKSTGSTQRIKLSRSFATLRVQPHRRLSFDLSHNYFRILPTFDSNLIAVGLVDNLLFQGFSGGTNVEIPLHIVLHGAAGRSKTSADQKDSWNVLYGATLPQIPRLRLRLDVRHSRFASAAGSGDYSAVSVLRESTDRWRIEVQGGNQRFQSLAIGNSQSRFVLTNADLFLGRHVVMGIGGSVYRGGLQSYDQATASLGYRF